VSFQAKLIKCLAAAALATTGAALRAPAQKKTPARPAAQNAQKKNAERPEEPRKTTERPAEEGAAPSQTQGPPSMKAGGAAASKPKEDPNAARFVYEFEHPDFVVYFIRVEHDERGRGLLRFERRSDAEQVTEPLELAPAALERINARWEALNFLDSTAQYQGEKTFPSAGKTRLKMRRGGRERAVEFNYSSDKNAHLLADEYRRAADQHILVFEIKVALESQPLETPKLLDRLDNYLRRNYLSDAQQLLPLVRELTEDERVPLVGRNQAARILKKMTEKTGQ
jgi:hypothetical protein